MEKDDIIMRADLVFNNLKNCNHGDSIHVVESMRTVAKLISQGLTSGKLSLVLALEQIDKLEAKQLAYLKDKVESWTKK